MPIKHAAYENLGTGQRTTKGWHTSDDQLVTSSSFGTTPKHFGGGDGPL
jgi:hypothetical protein